MRNFSSHFRSFLKPLALATVIAISAINLTFAQEAPADSAATAAPAGAAGGGPSGDATAGEALFKSNCGACHAIDKRVLGPALAGINEKQSNEWLHKWIKNSSDLIASGDKDAVAIFEEYNKVAMPGFPQLSDTDVDDILTYIKDAGAKKAAPVAGVAEGAAPADTGVSSFMIIGLIAVVLIAFLVIVVLNRVIGTLERLLVKKEDEIDANDDEEGEGKDRLAVVKKLAKNKKFVFFVVLALLITLGSFGYMDLWNTGVQTGYQPVQPIKFSHQLHAGTNQIECQYCHSGAWKSKNATIPSLNVCMNCHKYVQATDKYNGEISPEIQKIYTALDYNPETQKYGTNTRPIEWVRIHNLPDLAYFNHSQHVKVAGIDCQKCHGPIQEMAEVYQYSPLTMKWCINCHKETEVNSKGNAYYDKVIAAHDQIKKGEKVTAAVLGGLECGKCHY
ncbi:cytochrome c3 family protein [Pedobacter arcticus]|uniref:cytochrome c3 family protein n=1 Tax=Pedobacter arcticus TaxID=752140 RepID=UPI0002E4E3DB|nr:cytochrome c3 family protein [Pedobacter arcticus]